MIDFKNSLFHSIGSDGMKDNFPGNLKLRFLLFQISRLETILKHKAIFSHNYTMLNISFEEMQLIYQKLLEKYCNNKVIESLDYTTRFDLRRGINNVKNNGSEFVSVIKKYTEEGDIFHYFGEFCYGHNNREETEYWPLSASMPFRIALSIILDKDCITEDSIICTGEANSRGVCGEIQIPNLIPINHFVGLGIGTQLEWNEELAKTSANKAKYYENYLLLLNIAVSEVIRIKKELSLPFDIVDIVKEKPFELPETYDTSKQLILSKKINSTKV